MRTWVRPVEAEFIHPERGAMTLERNAALYAWHGRHHTPTWRPFGSGWAGSWALRRAGSPRGLPALELALESGHDLGPDGFFATKPATYCRAAGEWPSRRTAQLQGRE